MTRRRTILGILGTLGLLATGLAATAQAQTVTGEVFPTHCLYSLHATAPTGGPGWTVSWLRVIPDTPTTFPVTPATTEPDPFTIRTVLPVGKYWFVAVLSRFGVYVSTTTPFGLICPTPTFPSGPATSWPKARLAQP